MAQPDFGTALWKAVECIRVEKGYTKRKIKGDLASFCDVSPETIQKWKSRSIPNRTKIELIARWGVEQAGMDRAWVDELCRAGDQHGCASVVENVFPANRRTESHSQSKFTLAPLDDNQIRMYRIGAIELPIIHLGGSPKTPFTMDEVVVHFRPETFEDQPDYPIALKRVKPYLFNRNVQRYAITHFKDNFLPRLDKIEQEPEDANDHRGKLHLHFSQTTFSATLTTNNALDFKVISTDSAAGLKMVSIREAFCTTPLEDLSASVLANPVGVEVVVLSHNDSQTPKDQIIIRRRSQNVIFYNGYYQAAASGYMTFAHADLNALPNPFVTAAEESNQEVADSLQASPGQYHMTGIVLLWETLHPSVIGYIQTSKPINQIIGDFRRDAYEGILTPLPFNPKTILTHIANENWTPVSAMAVISSLLTFFPYNEVRRIAHELPQRKTWRDYLTNV